MSFYQMIFLSGSFDNNSIRVNQIRFFLASFFSLSERIKQSVVSFVKGEACFNTCFSLPMARALDRPRLAIYEISSPPFHSRQDRRALVSDSYHRETQTCWGGGGEEKEKKLHDHLQHFFPLILPCNLTRLPPRQILLRLYPTRRHPLLRHYPVSAKTSFLLSD